MFSYFHYTTLSLGDIKSELGALCFLQDLRLNTGVDGGRTVSECEEYSMFLSVRLAGLSSDHTEQVLS